MCITIEHDFVQCNSRIILILMRKSWSITNIIIIIIIIKSWHFVTRVGHKRKKYDMCGEPATNNAVWQLIVKSNYIIIYESRIFAQPSNKRDDIFDCFRCILYLKRLKRNKEKTVLLTNTNVSTFALRTTHISYGFICHAYFWYIIIIKILLS